MGREGSIPLYRVNPVSEPTRSTPSAHAPCRLWLILLQAHCRYYVSAEATRYVDPGHNATVLGFPTSTIHVLTVWLQRSGGNRYIRVPGKFYPYIKSLKMFVRKAPIALQLLIFLLYLLIPWPLEASAVSWKLLHSPDELKEREIHPHPHAGNLCLYAAEIRPEQLVVVLCIVFS